MEELDLSRLVYLVILGTVIAGYFFASNRQSLGTTARHAMLWVLIFVGVIAGVGLWSDVRDTVLPSQAVFAEEGRIVIPRSRDGHYYVTATLNGAAVNFVVDTGATDVVLSQEDAERAGLDPDGLVYSGRAFTANGTVETALARVEDFSIDGIQDSNVTVSVNGGPMQGSLLGMSYLDRYDRIEIANNQLVLHR